MFLLTIYWTYILKLYNNLDLLLNFLFSSQIIYKY